MNKSNHYAMVVRRQRVGRPTHGHRDELRAVSAPERP